MTMFLSFIEIRKHLYYPHTGMFPLTHPTVVKFKRAQFWYERHLEQAHHARSWFRSCTLFQTPHLKLIRSE